MQSSGSGSELTQGKAMSVACDVSSLLGAASKLLDTGVDVCVATVIESHGSGPSTPGQKMLLGSNGVALGTVGGGAIERDAVVQMKALLGEPQARPQIHSYALEKDLAMACGGSVKVLLEPMRARPRLLLVGAGHIGLELAHLLTRLGFALVVVDSRPEAFGAGRFEAVQGVTLRVGLAAEVAKDIAPEVPVLVATHDHELDAETVLWAVVRGHSYVGGVGSRNKAKKTRELLRRNNVAASAIDRLRMPVGLPIGGGTPQEIALSIAAEIVAWRAGTLGALLSALSAGQA